MEIKNHPDHPEVFEGEKVSIIDYDFCSPNEAVQLSKLPYVTIDSVDKHPIGSDGEYHWEYGIYIKECPGALLTPDNYVKL